MYAIWWVVEKCLCKFQNKNKFFHQYKKINTYPLSLLYQETAVSSFQTVESGDWHSCSSHSILWATLNYQTILSQKLFL